MSAGPRSRPGLAHLDRRGPEHSAPRLAFVHRWQVESLIHLHSFLISRQRWQGMFRFVMSRTSKSRRDGAQEVKGRSRFARTREEREASGLIRD